MSAGISGFERWALVCLSTIEGAAETHCRVQVPLSNCRSSLDQVLCFLSPCGLSRNPTGSTASGDTSSQARSRCANPVFLLLPHSLPVVFLMIHWSQRHHSPGSLNIFHSQHQSAFTEYLLCAKHPEGYKDQCPELIA